jgi:hypothetical protein
MLGLPLLSGRSVVPLGRSLGSVRVKQTTTIIEGNEAVNLCSQEGRTTRRCADGDSHGQEVRADGDQPHGRKSPGAVVGRGEERHVDDGLAKDVWSDRYRGIQYYLNKIKNPWSK